MNRTATRIAKYAAIPAALIASGAIVAQASYSAYSATTTNPTNTWASGTVNLTDDDTSTALFTAANLKPGATGAKCLAVTSTGTLPATVKLYATTPTTTKNLAANITVTITQGSGGSYGSCTGFTAATTNPTLYSGSLDTLGTTATTYSNGLGSWTTLGGKDANETRTYQVTYTLNSNAPDTTQGGTAGLGLTFEAQNN